MERKNAICLLIDGLHAGMVGAYGNSWIRTPALDRLATKAFVFDQAYVESLELAAIRDSLFGDAGAGAGNIGLLDQLHASGVHTWLLTDNPSMAEQVSERFEQVMLLPSETADELAEEIADTQLARFFAAATELLERLESPFFVCLHMSSLTSVWDAPYELRDQYTDEEDPQPPEIASAVHRTLPKDFDPDELLGIAHAYAGQVSLLDACLGLWLESWQQTAGSASTLLSVTGLRGFALGEHGQVGIDEALLTGELVHVPWMVRLPDGQGALARSLALVSQSDFGPTLLEWFAGSAHDSSVLPIVAGERDELRQAVYLRSATEQAIRTPAWYLRLTGERDDAHCKLFAKPSDRWEVNEVSDRCRDIAESLRELVLAHEQGHDLREPLAAELVTQFD